MELVESDLSRQAKELIQAYPNSKIFAFKGNLGAGKTTFIKHLCRSLGVTDALSSPSFGIINEYITKDSQKVYHIDLYRVNSAEDLREIGLEELLYSGNYCFLEWPEIAKHILPPETMTFIIDRLQNKRYLRSV
jgi:tRNA threonylcarbamoyladenosine biosynthesis protein TsaE